MAIPVGHGGIDYPDFGVSPFPHDKEVTISNAEVAIRLGCPQVFERTGNILHIEQFKSGYGSWKSPLIYSPDSTYLVASEYKTVPYSILLKALAAGAHISGIRRKFDFPYKTSIGLEVGFLCQADFNYLNVECYLGENGDAYGAFIRIDDTNTNLQYRTRLGPYQVIGTYDLKPSLLSGWHVVKVVIDFENLQYERVMLDREDYSLKDISLYKMATVLTNFIEVRCLLTGTAARTDNIWIDDIILTMNEPVY